MVTYSLEQFNCGVVKHKVKDIHCWTWNVVNIIWLAVLCYHDHNLFKVFIYQPLIELLSALDCEFKCFYRYHEFCVS